MACHVSALTRSSLTRAVSSNTMSNQNNSGNHWFNDRRFHFNGTQRVRNHVTSLLADLNQVTQQNPETVNQLRQQLTRLADMLNTPTNQQQHQSLNRAASGLSSAANSVPSGDTVVDIGSIAQQSSAVNEQTDASSSGTSYSNNDTFANSGQATSATSAQSALGSSSAVTPSASTDSTVETEAAQQQEQTNEWQRVSEMLQSPEIQHVVRAAVNFLPFLVILAIKLMFEHISGLLIFTLFTFSFFFCDVHIRKQVSARSDARPLAIFCILTALLSDVATLYVFQYDDPFYCLFFRPPPIVYRVPMDLLTLLYLTILTDFLIKFLSMILKCLILLVPFSVSPYKRRGRLYRWVEITAQLYRFLVAAVLWTCYLLSSDYESTVLYILSIGLVVAYYFFKLRLSRRMFVAWWETSKLLAYPFAYGRTPKASDLANSGATCSICFAEYKDPIELACKHIFCEDCITVWFETSGSCPMCRQEIIYKENVLWKDGATTWAVQLY